MPRGICGPFSKFSICWSFFLVCVSLPLKEGSRCWHLHNSSPSPGTELRSVVQPVKRSMMHPLGKGSWNSSASVKCCNIQKEVGLICGKIYLLQAFCQNGHRGNNAGNLETPVAFSSTATVVLLSLKAVVSLCFHICEDYVLLISSRLYLH